MPNFSVIEQLGGKQLVMQLLGHEDPNVRYEALLAVQKLMVHNWYVNFETKIATSTTQTQSKYESLPHFPIATGSTWASSWRRRPK